MAHTEQELYGNPDTSFKREFLTNKIKIQETN